MCTTTTNSWRTQSKYDIKKKKLWNCDNFKSGRQENGFRWPTTGQFSRVHNFASPNGIEASDAIEINNYIAHKVKGLMR